MRAIYKKELKSYFTSAIAWVFLAFFLVLVPNTAPTPI